MAANDETAIEYVIQRTNMESLAKDLTDKPIDYILPRYVSNEYGGMGNIFFLAVYYGREDFLREAINNSSILDVCLLLSEQEPDLNHINPLHLAAMKGNLGIVSTILEFYNRTDVAEIAKSRPWLATDSDGETPLHLAMMNKHQDVALAILLSAVVTEEQQGNLCNLVDRIGETPFSLAVKQGLEPVVSMFFDLFGRSVKALRQMLSFAALNGREELVRRAIDSSTSTNSLPTSSVQDALFRQESLTDNTNLLHVAAIGGHPGIVKLMLDVAANRATRIGKPWLKKDLHNRRPLDYALMPDKEECACRILSMDLRVFCRLLDADGNSVLSVALEKGLKQVASDILGSGFQYSLSRNEGANLILHVIHERCSDFCEQLIEQRKDQQLIKVLDKRGFTVLQSWLEKGYIQLIKRILETQWRKDLIELISPNHNPFHVVATSTKIGDSDMEAAQLLIDAYRQELPQPISNETDSKPIWLMKNKDGCTPLHLAIRNGREKLASFLILVQIYSDTRFEPPQDGALFHAVEKGCDDVVIDAMVVISGCKDRCRNLLISVDRRNVLHIASKCSETVGKLLVKEFPEYAGEVDINGKIPLHYAAMAGVDWLIRQLLKIEPLDMRKAKQAFTEAYKNGHLAILAFIEHEDFRRACKSTEDPCHFLHELKLNSFKEYKDLLESPFVGEFLNSIGDNDATPLHTAIERKDIHYAEALLSAGARQSVKNKEGKTALNLLQKRCMTDGGEWISMCQRVGVYKQITDFKEVRGTLSIVAGLMATLTFTAGFTLPGGLNQDTGKAIMGNRPYFTAFLLADAYAMCCSILALFFLTSSKCSDELPVLRFTIESSSFLVMQSLYGSLVAFMTGIYTVLSHHRVLRLWPAFVIFLMCSLVAFVATIFSRNKKECVEWINSVKCKFSESQKRWFDLVDVVMKRKFISGKSEEGVRASTSSQQLQQV